LQLDDGLDSLVTELDGTHHRLFVQLVGAGLDHHDGVFRAGDHQVKPAERHLRIRGVHYELTLDVADANPRQGTIKGDVGDREGGGCAEDGKLGGVVLTIGGEDGDDDLGLVAIVLREERPNGTVGQASGQDGVSARSTLALDEATRELAGGIHALFVIHREGEEVDALSRRV